MCKGPQDPGDPQRPREVGSSYRGAKPSSKAMGTDNSRSKLVQELALLKDYTRSHLHSVTVNMGMATSL